MPGVSQCLTRADPNIAAIYGLEGNAIVMELVEGVPLCAPMPVKKALAVARQIAEALETAHDKGIIHRDLKPPSVPTLMRQFSWS